MNRLGAGSAWKVPSFPWVVLVAIAAIGVLFQLAVGGVLVPQNGPRIEFSLDLVLFGIVNPLLAFWALTVVLRAREKASLAEKHAAETELLLGAINLVASDAIVRLDPGGRIVSWNRRAETLFGYPAREMRGRAFAALLGADDAKDAWRQIKQMMPSGEVVRGYECGCQASDGATVKVKLAGRNLVDEAGRSLGTVVVLHDITARRQRTELIEDLNRRLADQVEQLALSNAELERANCDFAELPSVVSHQIRGPLGNMVSAVCAMRAGCGDPTDTCSRMFEVFEQQGRHLDGLVRGLLNAANIEAGRLVLHREPIPASAVVQQVVESFHPSNGHCRRICRAVSRDLPAVDADRDRLAEVLTNLLDNADKYSPAGTEIVIEAEAGAEWVTVQVRDHGPGLPADALDRVFDKFYRADTSETRATRGYGLGLYICRQFVEAHGGTIRAANHAGGGAVFSFTLPIAK